MSATHDSYEETHVSIARQPIKSLVFTSKKASFAVHMASSNASPAAFGSPLSTSNDCVDQITRPRTPYLNPIQLATHALGAQHALPQHHTLASKNRNTNTVVPLVLLSSHRARGRPDYTRALFDARTSAYSTPGPSALNFTSPCSSPFSHIRNTQSTTLNAHSTNAVRLSNPIHREGPQVWQSWKHSNTAIGCFCSLKPCICVAVTLTTLRHSSEGSSRASTKIQYPYVPRNLMTISPPSLSPSTSINTDASMTPTVDTPSFAYTDLQTGTVYFKEESEDQEERHQQTDPSYTAKSPRVLCSCERQPLNALRMSSLSPQNCTECAGWNLNSCPLVGS